MELRHLRYFAAVAEQLNFTRAARQLNISQPPLTQQIQRLEQELGVALFDRSQYRISLTPAGKAFQGEVQRILGDVRGAIQVARRAAAGETGRVRVGFTESASFHPIVTTAVSRYRARYPEVEVSLEEHPSTELATALREERLDMAFLRPPLPGSDGLTLHVLTEEAMVVAVPRGSPLARRKQVALRDLASEHFILYPRAVRPGLADAVIAACQRVGFTPKVRQYAPQLSSTINLVAASLGLSIVPECMHGLQPHAVRYLGLRGRPIRASLGLAFRAGEASANVAALAGLATELGGRRS